jgi:hypothetical protein
MATFKTKLFAAFDNAHEVTMGFPDSGTYPVDFDRTNDSGDGREFVANGGDDVVDALDQEIEVDESGGAKFKDINGAEVEAWFEIIEKRAIAAADIQAGSPS